MANGTDIGDQTDASKFTLDFKNTTNDDDCMRTHQKNFNNSFYSDTEKNLLTDSEFDLDRHENMKLKSTSLIELFAILGDKSYRKVFSDDIKSNLNESFNTHVAPRATPESLEIDNFDLSNNIHYQNNKKKIKNQVSFSNQKSNSKTRYFTLTVAIDNKNQVKTQLTSTPKENFFREKLSNFMLKSNKKKSKTEKINTFTKLRSKLRSIIHSNIFNRSILISISLNALIMSMEHHNQPRVLTLIVEYSNHVFTVIFLIEMILKILASGVYNYIKSAYNAFDTVIVCIR